MTPDMLSFKDAPSWLRDRVLWLLRAGSHAYGTSTPTSDLDLRGICSAPKRHVLGFAQRFQQFQCDEPDVLVLELRRFFSLAADAQAWVIEMLFVDAEDVLHRSPVAERIIERREMFLSRKLRHTFSGYAMAQMKRLRAHRRYIVDPPAVGHEDRPGYEQWLKRRSPKRAALEDKFGYDTKFGMHVVRLMRMAKEALEDGKVIVRRPDAQELRAIRDGAWSFDELERFAQESDAALDAIEARSPLPKSPDREALDELCCTLVEETIRQENTGKNAAFVPLAHGAVGALVDCAAFERAAITMRTTAGPNW